MIASYVSEFSHTSHKWLAALLHFVDPQLLRCKCTECAADNHSRADCINNKCQCCDLEDTFALLTHVEPDKYSMVA